MTSQRRKLSAYDVLLMVEMDAEYSRCFIAKTFSVSIKHVSRILHDPNHYVQENNLSTGVFQQSSSLSQPPVGAFRIVTA